MYGVLPPNKTRGIFNKTLISYTGDPGIVTVGGLRGYSFNGSSQYINIGAVPNNLTQLSYLVYAIQGSGAGFSLTTRQSGTEGMEILHGGGGIPGDVQIRFQTNTGSVDGATINVSQTAPNIYIATANTAGNLILYVNDINNRVLDNLSSFGGVVNSTQNLHLAYRTVNPSFGNFPAIYLALCWTRELSQNEVNSLLQNPWQVFAPAPRRIWSAPSGGTNTYTLAVSGGVTFSGSTPLRRERKQVPSGGVTFSGSIPLLRTRTQIPSGGVTFGGTAPITFNAPNIYTIIPSGGVTLSGAVPLLRERLFAPSGAVSFSGTVPLIRTRITVPSGQVTFSGSTPITFIPAGGIPYVPTSRISVGSARASRIS